MGRCGLIPWTINGRSEVEVAYMLGKQFWGQGLGVEIIRALVRHGFSSLGLKRLIALIAPENLPSIRSAEKSGFRYERRVIIQTHTARLYSILARSR
jgi:ribosomal-protein-alanine N-acetyltransferase